MVGLTRFELVTPRLSSVCSNQLSYRPVKAQFKEPTFARRRPVLSKLDRTCVHLSVCSADREACDTEYQIDHFK